MDIKRKLILGTATAILGLSLVGAPTYAYLFSSENSSIETAGDTIDLNTNTQTIIQVDNIKPGDSDELFVQFEFVDNNQKQDVFQGDTLELNWTFEGIAE